MSAHLRVSLDATVISGPVLGTLGCATLILICQWARLAVVRTPPIDPTARGSSNYGGRGDSELWGMETHTGCELCYIELWGAETPGSVVR